jgi:hypothetical protein
VKVRPRGSPANMTTYQTFPSSNSLSEPSDEPLTKSSPNSTVIHDDESSTTSQLPQRRKASESVSPTGYQGSTDFTIDMDPFDRHFSQNGMPFVNDRVPRSSSVCRKILTAVKNFFKRDDIIKFLLAFLYLFCVMFFLSNLLVVVHLRMPNNETWGHVKPLPDLLLEWFALQNWGLWLSEVFIQCMTVIIFVLAAFHAHTFILLRRMFCVMATVFFLRSFSVLVTSLTPSVAKLPDDCGPLHINSTAEFLGKAIRIFLGMGMRLQGGQTCGDYVYSGHTCSLTIFNLFFISYSPNNSLFIPMKLVTCFINLFGMLGILVSHEHYSVDVLLGAAISYFVFSEYHYVTSYLHLTKSTTTDQTDLSITTSRRYRRIKIVSPIVYFMERGGDGRVENRFRIPLYETCQRSSWQALGEPHP